ncbi:MAG: hypothetical protein ACHQF0_05555 [Chitinophagales bacterium]
MDRIKIISIENKKMKSLLTSFFSCGVLIIFCNNSSGPGIGSCNNKTEPASMTSLHSLQKGYGAFTFMMNGKQRTFTAWHTFIVFPIEKSTEILLFEDGGPGGAGFDFKINKQGPTEFKTGYANTLLPKLLFSFFDTTGVSYIGDGMLVNVTSLSANRLTGTFSGKFVKEKYQIKENSNAGILQVIEVTNGKFDLHK